MNDLIFLGMLLHGPKHGYRLKKEAELLSSGQKMHSNTVYPLLHRLLKEGWISERQAKGEKGQTRIMYALTSQGRSALKRKVAEFSEEDAASEQAFRLRVGMFSLLSQSAQRMILERRDQVLVEKQTQLIHAANSPKLNKWSAVTLEFVCKQLSMERKWIAELITLSSECTTAPRGVV